MILFLFKPSPNPKYNNSLIVLSCILSQHVFWLPTQLLSFVSYFDLNFEPPTILQAVKPDASVIYVPPPFAANAIMDAVEAEIPLGNPTKHIRIPLVTV